MSATVERNNVSWRKRRRQEESTELQINMKKPRYYYYRLASESSRDSEEDTESIYSIQGRETDVVRDTTDTDSKSGSDTEEYELIEYEVASLSGSEHAILGNSSSDSDDHVLFAAAIGAMCDSSIETWITDCEESDNSSLDDSVVTRLGFSTCVQCKSPNDNPLYRYCEKCFQHTCKQCKKRKTYKCFPLCVTCHKDRKKLYPPRPRAYKKPKNKAKAPPVKLDTLRSCLSGLSSQDSGVGSSQECPPLDLDQIVVPDQHLKPGTSEISSKPDNVSKENASKDTERDLKRKRHASESSLSDFDIVKPKFSRKDLSPKSKRNARPSSRNSEEKRAKNQSDSLKKTTDSLSLNQSSTETSKEQNLSQNSIDDKPLSQLSTETLSSQTSTESFSQPSERSLTLRSSRSKPLPSSQSSSGGSEISTSTGSVSSETSELCIMCNSAPKDTIFLHTNIGHLCCCYKCAKRTLDTIKRCPICNRSVSKVIKIFQT